MRAEDILSAKGHNVVTVAPDAALDDAIRVLADRNIGAVLVCEDDRLVGILSERDVVRALAGAPTGFRGTMVSELMTRELRTARPDASVDDLLDMMTERRIRHLPVMEGERLVGVLSIGDVVKHRMREVTDEAEQLKSYIAS